MRHVIKRHLDNFEKQNKPSSKIRFPVKRRGLAPNISLSTGSLVTTKSSQKLFNIDLETHRVLYVEGMDQWFVRDQAAEDAIPKLLVIG